jgi:hypothetical protein
MFNALKLSPKEIRRRLNKNNGLVREKLKQAGMQALLQRVVNNNKESQATLIVYRDVLLLQAEDELDHLEDLRKSGKGWRVVKK